MLRSTTIQNIVLNVKHHNSKKIKNVVQNKRVTTNCLMFQKKAWRIIIPVAILLLFGITNPSKTKHVEAIHTELMKAIAQDGGNEATVYASLGAGIIDKVLASQLDVKQLSYI